jgi:selenide, water dikinase
VVDPALVSVLHGTWELIEAGHVPGGTRRNLDFVVDHLDAGGHDERVALVLADPQTSGGLLFSVGADRAADALEDLRRRGVPAEDVGELVAADGPGGRILLR